MIGSLGSDISTYLGRIGAILVAQASFQAEAKNRAS